MTNVLVVQYNAAQYQTEKNTNSLSSVWQIQTHNTIMRVQQASIGSKVSWAARIRLNINTPLLWIKPEALQRSLLTQQLHLINKLIAAVIPAR